VDWRVLILKKSLMARVPFGEALRRAKRNRVGYRPNRSNLETTLENYASMQAAASAAGRPIAGARVLEIGSGWFPVIPILLCMDGAREVVMTDLNRHMDEVTFGTATDYLRERFPERTALNGVRKLSDLPLRYLAPYAPADVADGSVDLVVSRTVLEHIDPAPMVELLAGLRPKLAPGARMVHLVDHSDHLQHIDRSLSPVNFLSWSPRWHRTVNRLIREGENRLRHHEYAPLFERAGLQVVLEQGEPHAATLESLRRLRLAQPYDRMRAEQLSVLVSIYALKAAEAAEATAEAAEAA